MQNMKNQISNQLLTEQHKFFDLLTKYQDLFYGTLGDWNTEPVSFELNNDANLYDDKAYPPHMHKNKPSRRSYTDYVN